MSMYTRTLTFMVHSRSSSDKMQCVANVTTHFDHWSWTSKRKDLEILHGASVTMSYQYNDMYAISYIQCNQAPLLILLLQF